jgi:hypothetical protein
MHDTRSLTVAVHQVNAEDFNRATASDFKEVENPIN